MTFTTSYKTPEIENLITSLVSVADPQVAVDIGTQQGKSATLIGKGMKKGACLHTFDLFEDTYRAPPYKPTHSSENVAKENLEAANLECHWLVHKNSGVNAVQQFASIDLLHIDICNHKGNVKDILDGAAGKVRKMILLEGGVHNSWQRSCGYDNFLPLLELYTDFTYAVIKINEEENALTIMTRIRESSK